MADPIPHPRPAWLVAAVLLAAAPAVGLPLAALGAVSGATEGADTLIGGPDAEVLEGLGGADSIRGMDGQDLVNGNGGNDTVGGGPGDDEVHGGQGDDDLNGGQGDDTVSGDRGDDTVAGGLGADRFRFDAAAGRDVVSDFTPEDRVELPAGADYAIMDTGEGVVIRLGADASLRLAGVRAADLGPWLVLAAPATETAFDPLRRLAPEAAAPPPRRSPLLLAAIMALAMAFFGLLAVGLMQMRGGRRGEG